MCLKQKGVIPTLGGMLLKLVNKFTYFGSSISSTEIDINIRQTNAWNAIDGLTIIRKSDPSDQIKQDFFLAVAA